MKVLNKRIRVSQGYTIFKTMLGTVTWANCP